MLRALAALLFIPLSLDAVTVGWDGSSGAIAYEVHYGPASHTYSQLISTTNTTVHITNAAPGMQMFMAVKAVNGELESDFSNEIMFTVPMPVITNTVLTVDHSDDPFGPWTNKVSLTNLMGWRGFYRVNLVVNTNQ